jgi:hypothetical protein
MSDMTVQSGTRGSAYTHQDVTITDESITINQFKIAPQLIDRADLAQSEYANQMVLADRQGKLLNEAIETAMFASHASFTDFVIHYHGEVFNQEQLDTPMISKMYSTMSNSDYNEKLIG